MSRFITDRKADTVDVLKVRSPEDRQAILERAQRVYAYVRRNEWIAENELRAYGERNGIAVDQMSEALNLLQQLGRLHAVPDVAVLPDAPVPSP